MQIVSRRCLFPILSFLTSSSVLLGCTGSGEIERVRLPHLNEEVDLCVGVVCSTENSCAASAACDPTSGECVYRFEQDGTSCDDGNACTFAEICQSGVCVSGGTLSCESSDPCQLDGVCDPSSGCVYEDAPEQTVCDDGDACTTEDSCAGGACGGSPKTCAAPGECQQAGFCDSASGSCRYDNKANGTACGSDLANCQVGACFEGVCEVEDVVCVPQDACHEAGACDMDTGECSNPAKPNGSICDDGDVCTESEPCQAGECLLGTPVTCESPGDCRGAGECIPGVGCGNYEVLPDDTLCDDEDLCTQMDSCRAGSCVGENPVICDAPDSCHRAGICDPQSGLCSAIPKQDGTSCDDEDACTENTSCTAGECGAGEVVLCEALDQCHEVGSCDPILGCSNPEKPDDTSCDDSSLCTQSDSCQSGVCVGAADVVCDALDDCHNPGICSADTGLCSNPAKADGSLCDDEDACTQIDVCRLGLCAGEEPIFCSPDGCLIDPICDPGTGVCTGAQKANGQSCISEDLCVSEAVCDQGECLETAEVQCSSAGSCYDAGVCDSVTGQCTRPPAFSGSLCEDGVCFEEVAEDMRLDWDNRSDSVLTAAAVAVFDFNQDGYLDVAFGGDRGGLRVFRNNVGVVFTEVTQDLGISPKPVSPVTSLAAGDYDNDGLVDLYVTTESVNLLYRNVDGSSFVDVASSMGVRADSFSSGASFVDYDGDGDLDLYVSSYQGGLDLTDPANPRPIGLPNRLFRNEGSVFVDVAPSLGLAGDALTVSALWSDLDSDGDPDLLICNDFGEIVDGNKYYENSGGTFTESSAVVGLDQETYCRGFVSADFDRDGDLDYYLSNMGANAMLMSDGASFSDEAVAIGLEANSDQCLPGTQVGSWGSGFADFDRDGWPDLYVGHGYLDKFLNLPLSEYSANGLYLNNAGSSVTDASASAGVSDSRAARGVALGDLDNDGDIDTLQVHANGSPLYYRNTQSENSWVMVSLIGTRTNVHGIGAQALITAGGYSTRFEVNRQSGYGASHDPRLLVGLGLESEADMVEVFWPGGVTQRFFNIPSGSYLEAVEIVSSLENLSVSTSIFEDGQTVDVDFDIDHQLGNTFEVFDYRVELFVNGSAVAGSAELGVANVGSGAVFPVSLEYDVPADASGGVVQSAYLVVTLDDGNTQNATRIAATLSP